MRNIKLVIQYDGSRYKGFQNQKDTDLTVQAKLEAVLTKMAEEPIEIIGCDRMDVGVHAENYVASFKTECTLSEACIADYLYSFLPEDIVVKKVEEVEDRFHARYNVKAKTYVYTINNREYRDVFNRRYVYHTNDTLNSGKMREAAELLIGNHDFAGFTSLKANGKSTMKTINEIEITEGDQMITIKVTADDFLLHMPRLIIGALLEVGTGKWSIKEVKQILDEKQKPERSPMAKAKGLCLTQVKY